MIARVSLLLAGLLLAALPLRAQQAEGGRIEGRVAGAETGAAVPGANVTLDGTTIGNATDADGRFVLTGVAPGDYTLVASAVGYAPRRREVTLDAGETLRLDITLEERPLELEGVMVEGQTEATRLESSAQAVDVIELDVAQTRTDDLGAVLAGVEGVNVRRSGGLGSGARLSLNGLSGDQVRFFLDGLPLERSGYPIGLANVPVGLVERVEIYKGVVPIRFGADALGGAVNLVTPRGFAGTEGSASYQAGAFGTHRLAANVMHRGGDGSSGGRGGLLLDASAFFDRADNDYEIDVEVPDERGRLSDVTVPRFHDGYRAFGANVKVGVAGASWADELSLRAFATRRADELQHNNVMTVPYGEIESDEETYGATARYARGRDANLGFDLSAGYSYNETSFRDLSTCVYDWFGDCIRERAQPGELGAADDQRIGDHSAFARLNASWAFADGHRLALSVAPTFVSREGEDFLRDPGELDPLAAQRDLLTLVSGLEYGLTAAEDRLEATFFAKDYVQAVRSEDTQAGGGVREQNRDTHRFGAGGGLRYHLTPRLRAKASYEWAVRLPRTEEVFGNGILLLPNLDLAPERSHNVNANLLFQSAPGASTDWQMELGGFLRSADQLIVLLGNGQAFSFQNVFAANSAGLEGSAAWTLLDDRLTLAGNATWQEFRNASGEGPFGAFEGDRIPNRPYFFANGSAQFAWPALVASGDRLTLFGSARYVNEFFRSWESAGLTQFKETIPSQLAADAGVTYRLPLAPLDAAVTAQVQNVTGAEVFDFFGVQRPGRAFYLKLTTQF